MEIIKLKLKKNLFNTHDLVLAQLLYYFFTQGEGKWSFKR